MRQQPTQCLMSVVYITWIFSILANVHAIPQGGLGVHGAEKSEAREKTQEENESDKISPDTRLGSLPKHDISRPLLPRWVTLPKPNFDIKEDDEPEDDLDSIDIYQDDGDDRSGIEMNRLPYAHGLRRLLGDLETCTDDLFPSMNNGAGGGFHIRGSKFRSCRQALFTFLRWAKGQRKQWSDVGLSVPEREEAAIMKRGWREDTLDTQQEHAARSGDGNSELDLPPGAYKSKLHPHGVQPRAATDKSPRMSKCQESACKVADLSTLCTHKKEILKPGIGHTCNMCFPERNDNLILEHCKAREKKERQVFYILCAMLITIGGVAGVLMYFHKERQKLRHRTDSVSANEEGRSAPMAFRLVNNPTLGVKLKKPAEESWASIIATRVRRKKSLTPDVERQPSPTKFRNKSLGTHALLQTPARSITSPKLSRQYSRTASIEGIDGARIIPTGRTTSLQMDMTPMMPRARSFSVQIPPSASATGSTSADIDGGTRGDPNPARRGGLSRRAGTR